MAAPLVYADFNNLDDANRLKLDRAGTMADLNQLGIKLVEGLPLTFYSDDEDDQGRPDRLFVEGTVERNADENCWVGAIDWDRIRHESEERPENGVSTNRQNK